MMSGDCCPRPNCVCPAEADRLRAPIPMILTCPSCGGRHVDAGEFAERPHHTHACQHCGSVWRPAIVHTVGVQFLPGFRDGPSGVSDGPTIVLDPLDCGEPGFNNNRINFTDGHRHWTETPAARRGIRPCSCPAGRCLGVQASRATSEACRNWDGFKKADPQPRTCGLDGWPCGCAVGGCRLGDDGYFYVVDSGVQLGRHLLWTGSDWTEARERATGWRALPDAEAALRKARCQVPPAVHPAFVHLVRTRTPVGRVMV